MIRIIYLPVFMRRLSKLERGLKDEIYEKIELFKDENNHKMLKVHKLHGKLVDCYSFSVNYKFRVVFEYEAKDKVVFLDIGDHEVYK